MYFQKVVKGISGLSLSVATEFVTRSGIPSNWLKQKKKIQPGEFRDQLTDYHVLHHLNNYDDPLPLSHPLYVPNAGMTYGQVTPLISTTAGAIERDPSTARNICFPAFFTALQFATRNFTVKGYVFYAYLNTLGKKTVPLVQFSEEVRELHIYRQFLPYHREGEIVAKISIPSPQIEKAEEYDGPAALVDMAAGVMPGPLTTIPNPSYANPQDYTNIREYF